jgi:hypothetical protein
MDLKPFVGKRVLLQFKPGVAYAVVTRMETHLAPLLMKNPEGAPQPVVVPYIDGRIEEMRIVVGDKITTLEGAYVLIYNDQAAGRGRKAELQVAVSPELIGFVTVHGEEHTAASSVILTP